MNEIVMPRLGNTVESAVIVEWRKEVGEQVNVGDVLCEVETDKSTTEVEAEAAGILLARLFNAGDEVPVQSRFAIIGEEGEDVSALLAPGIQDADVSESTDAKRSITNGASLSPLPETSPRVNRGDYPGISPRARRLALSAGFNPRSLAASTAGGAALNSAATKTPIPGTGPGGRIIERDMTGFLARLPDSGVSSGTSDSIVSGVSAPAPSSEVIPAQDAAPGSVKKLTEYEKNHQDENPDGVEIIPVQGARKIIASRMRASLSKTAQLTLNSSAPAGSILAWHQSYKNNPMGGQSISINHLLMFSIARLLPHYSELNATFHGNEIRRYANVHLGFAVDTPRGLMTPVIRNANKRNLVSFAAEARRLADTCREGVIFPDELVGSTFTTTNLGVLGIENFTPVLNVPEVAILGIGAIINAPIETPKGIGIEKRIGLSLTIDHQALDGGTGARFLTHLVRVLTTSGLVAVL